MFDYFKRRYFGAGVMAELKAQLHDQEFVQRVCLGGGDRGSYSQRLEPWADRTAGIRQSNVRFLVAACGVLGDRLVNEDMSPDDLEICARLLSDRCSRIFGSHELLSICEGSVAVWMAELQRMGLE